jgi:hypothetical protein
MARITTNNILITDQDIPIFAKHLDHEYKEIDGWDGNFCSDYCIGCGRCDHFPTDVAIPGFEQVVKTATYFCKKCYEEQFNSNSLMFEAQPVQEDKMTDLTIISKKSNHCVMTCMGVDAVGIDCTVTDNLIPWYRYDTQVVCYSCGEKFGRTKPTYLRSNVQDDTLTSSSDTFYYRAPNSIQPAHDLSPWSQELKIPVAKGTRTSIPVAKGTDPDTLGAGRTPGTPGPDNDGLAWHRNNNNDNTEDPYDPGYDPRIPYDAPYDINVLHDNSEFNNNSPPSHDPVIGHNTRSGDPESPRYPEPSHDNEQDQSHDNQQDQSHDNEQDQSRDNEQDQSNDNEQDQSNDNEQDQSNDNEQDQSNDQDPPNDPGSGNPVTVFRCPGCAVQYRYVLTNERIKCTDISKLREYVRQQTFIGTNGARTFVEIRETVY